MRLIAFSGSPRKEWNTATLLRHALQGAAAEGAQTELVHLYDLDYAGCKSCFACKRKGSVRSELCAVQDDLAGPLARAAAADAVSCPEPR